MYSPDPGALKQTIKTLGNGVLLPPDPFTQSKRQQQQQQQQQQNRPVPQFSQSHCEGVISSSSKLNLSIEPPTRTSSTPNPSRKSPLTSPSKILSNSNISNKRVDVSRACKSTKVSATTKIVETSETSTDNLPYQHVDQINWQFPTKRNSIKFMVKNGIMPSRYSYSINLNNTYSHNLNTEHIYNLYGSISFQ